MTCLAYLAVTCVLVSTTAITATTEPPPPTTTLPDTTDEPTTDTSSNSTKERGTNRILNYGAVSGSSFGVFEYDTHHSAYPHPLPGPGPIPHPRPPFLPGLPAPGHIPPHHPPFPPHNGIYPATSSCKYYCPGRWHNQIYCCDNSPSYLGFKCPKVRDSCPGSHFFRHLRSCSEDRNCYFGEKCCLDACIGRHVCKAPERR
ncbi:uncharacterized protein LOC123519490 [Portunus trituberculatus]|uniref:uncharacterized protein LOC123519490 n=1 Tax=Portunus trituberculatus TaxID=210409 RepID=UPI001E1CE294|nr:uncharacterized protein LOC123519490 [Portunus trituberculatus]